MKRVAVIDLGSNSVRMNIVQIDEDGSYHLLDQVKQMVRLSQGMGEQKLLRPEPIRRTMETLQLFRKLIEAYGVREVHGVATAAVRQAVNQKEFLDQMERHTGFRFEVISGQEEARYDYIGVINTIEAPDCLVVDIGGASTELVRVQDREIQESISLPFGSVTLSERFCPGNPTPEDLERLKGFLTKEFKGIPWLKKAKGLPVLGLGGIIRTIGKIDKNRVRFPVLTIHNYQMNVQEVDLVYQTVTGSSLDEMREMAGVGKSRADLMAGGIMPVKVIMDLIRSEKLIISGNGLRDGVLFTRCILPKGQDLVPDVLEHSLDNLLKRYNVNREHARHVNRLCMRMFDQLQPIHGYSPFYRRVLHAAAMLHDIGMYIDYYNHHYHGFYLVMNAELNGLSNRERVLAAYLVGHHRESSFREDWRRYKAVVERRDFEDIRKLALCLRIAEKLDRSEAGLIRDVEVEIGKKGVALTLYAEGDVELEVSAVAQFRGEFRRLFRKELTLTVRH